MIIANNSWVGEDTVACDESDHLDLTYELDTNISIIMCVSYFVKAMDS